MEPSLSQQEPQMPKTNAGADSKAGSRRRIYVLDLEHLTRILRQDNRCMVKKGIPSDAVIVDMAPDILKTGKVSVLVEHESFNEVDENGQYPIDGEGIEIESYSPSGK